MDREHMRRRAAGLGELLDRRIHLAFRRPRVAPLGEHLRPGRERGAEVVVCLAEIRPQPRRILEVKVGPFHVAACELHRPEPVVGLPGVEVVLERVGPEGVLVHPRPRVAERQKREDREQHRRSGHEQPPLQLRRPLVPRGHAGRHEADDADHREVDEVVCRPGDPHVGDRHEAEHRRHHQEEEAEAEEGVAAPRGPVLPEPPAQGGDDRPGEELPDLRRIDLPLRVDRQQREGPENELEVEEHRHARTRQPRIEAADEDRLLADGSAVLVVDRDHAQDERDEEEGGRADQVGDGHRAPLPPDVEQDRHRHHHDRGLGEHRQQEHGDREEVVPVGGRRIRALEGDPVVELHVVDGGEQEERQREGVLEFRHPGDRLHTNRMHGEDRGPEPGARHVHHVEQPPQQEGAREVEQHRRQVVARRPHLEERPLHPQGRIAQRKVVGPVGVEPELDERAEVVGGRARIRRDAVLDGGVGREQLVVVPEPAGREERVVDRRVDPEHRQHDDREMQQEFLPAGGAALLVGRLLDRVIRGRGVDRAAR